MKTENIYFYKDNEGVLATFRKLESSKPNLVLTYVQLKAIYKNLKKERKNIKDISNEKIEYAKNILTELTNEERYLLINKLENLIIDTECDKGI